LVWLPLVLLAGTLLFYVLMSMHAHHMEEEQLELKQKNIRNALMITPEGIASHIRGEYDILKGNPVRKDWLNKQRDTTIYYPDNKEWVAFKLLTQQYVLKGEKYQLTTYVSSKEIAHLIIKVLVAEAVIFVLLLGAIVIINRKSSGLIWRPFYATMGKVKEYDIIKNQTLQLPRQTGISEFDQLNQVITNLVDNVNRAYLNQKQFVENASHELQTPLAIIRSKVELLADTSNLTEETAGLLNDITEANERLSQMNKNLLLLAKIDNNQFPEQRRVDFSNVVEKALLFYRDYWDGELPLIRESVEPGVYLMANASLLEILVTNLVKNSVVHNIPNGHVTIQLANHELVIENTGHSIAGSTEQLFERFKKGREGSETTGLGLSLVKQICHFYQFELQYSYADNIHRVRVNFGEG